MVEEIKSDAGVAASHAADLRKGNEPMPLEGVDDDNTLAESGVYNTYNDIKNAYSKSLSSLRVDSAHIEAAGHLYGDRDQELAQSLSKMG